MLVIRTMDKDVRHDSAVAPQVPAHAQCQHYEETNISCCLSIHALKHTLWVGSIAQTFGVDHVHPCAATSALIRAYVTSGPSKEPWPVRCHYLTKIHENVHCMDDGCH